MGKILVIAEKPSVARDYARVLKCREKGDGCLIGEDYIVSWALGHLIELCEPEAYDSRYKKWRYEDLPIIPEKMKLQVIRGSGQQFKVLKKLMNSKEVDSLICGTDSGREGELIFRYIYLVAGCKKPFQRLWVSSMTDEAISDAFSRLKDGKEYDSLYESARCRSEADWLVGINGSRAYSIQYDNLLSIGRVQTPTLSMIVKRQQEIDQFVPEDYFEVELTHPAGLNQKEDPSFTSTFFVKKDGRKVTRIDHKEEAENICAQAKEAGKAVVKEVTRTPGRQLPPLLYDLTELQRDANRRYGFSAARTLQIAQSLYEKHKLLTYPRTDSRYLPHDMKEKVRKTLYSLNVPDFHDALMGLTNGLNFTSRIIDDSKITDHHALIPTDKRPDFSRLSREENLIYHMVAMRLIEVFYPAYEYETVEVTLEAAKNLFLSRGRTVKQLGFMALRQQGAAKSSGDGNGEKKTSGKRASSKESSEENQTPLPEMTVGQEVPVQKAQVKQKQTKPPKPFTEATLLSAMEYAGKYIEDEELKDEMDKLSLGTPATRAAIIERLIKVKYIYRRGKTLVPTEKGKKLIAIVPVELKSPEMTGKWERSLDKIYHQQMDPGRFMGSIDRYVDYIVKSAADKREVTFSEEERPGRTRKSSVKTPVGTCPLCKGRIYRNSKAYYCEHWKDGCHFTVWTDSLKKYGANLTDDGMKKLLAGQKLSWEDKSQKRSYEASLDKGNLKVSEIATPADGSYNSE